MKIFAISDLHLSINNPKPMDIFGEAWEGYIDKIFAQWRELVSPEDIVLLAGDFSWAMKLEDAKADFNLISDLPGKKILIRGNHDYWWNSISVLRNALPCNMYAIQNDALSFNGVVICGTRGWQVVEDGVERTPEDERIFAREVIRLEMSLQAGRKLLQDGDKFICMMHYPPFNFTKSPNAFTDLLKKYQVDKVVYGHLHGYKNITLSHTIDGIEYLLTSCDERENKLTLVAEV